MRILKFGGTSVAGADRIAAVAGLVARAAEHDRVVVVVSALAGVTDSLVEAAARAARGEPSQEILGSLRRRHHDCLIEITADAEAPRAARALDRALEQLDHTLAGCALLGNCPPFARDRILAAGERLAVQLVATALRRAGLAADPIDATELIVTDSRHGDAAVDHAATRARTASRLRTVPARTVPVVTGFIGADRAGATTTLGRGGSDYTASLIGAALDAECVEIWTDVEGVMSAPPRLVPGAVTLEHLSYEEAAELAFFGAKVLHRETMRPLAARDIPIVVRSTQRPDGASTTIANKDLLSDARPCGVIAVEHVTLFTITDELVSPGTSTLASILTALAIAGVDVLAASHASAQSLARVVAPSARADEVAAVLQTGPRAGGPTRVLGRRDELSLLAVVGHKLAVDSNVAARALAALASHAIPTHAVWSGISDHAVTILVDHRETGSALTCLHNTLVLGAAREPAGALPASAAPSAPPGADAFTRKQMEAQ